jgi:hypothetical protein
MHPLKTIFFVTEVKVTFSVMTAVVSCETTLIDIFVYHFKYGPSKMAMN